MDEKYTEKQYMLPESLRRDMLALIASIKFSQYEHGVICQIEQALRQVKPYEKTMASPQS